MGDTKKTSVMKEALVEFKEIQDAADANAKKNLAEQFPDSYSKLLKEELNKNKKAKESYKKLDEAKESDKSGEDESNKEESVMKNQVKETKKVVKEADDKNQPFDKKAPEVGPDVVKEEREKDFMGDIESDTPNLGKGEAEDGDLYLDKITTKQDTVANDTTLKEEFDMTGLDMNSVGSALEGADAEDEVITMDEIEEEISAMNELETINTNPKSGPDDGIAYDKLVNMRNQIDEMIQGIGEQKNQGGKGANKVNPGGPTTAMIDEEEVAEQKNQGGKGANKVNPGGPTTAMIDEEEITDADVMAVLGGGAEGEQEVEENIQHTQTHSNARQVGANDNTNYGKASRLRDAMKNEGNEPKISSLINENKSLTKKLNETKKYKQSVTTLVEQYKSALEKYRNQLKEMATFNTNLAHVNNLLVNESLALTQEDKIKIINEFKKVDTIAESQEKYKAFLTEMKSSKKTLTESIEGKVSASVAPSSKQSLEEAKEVTAYADDDHIKKMKRLIEYAEKRGSKKII